jgi:hypothetical protein
VLHQFGIHDKTRSRQATENKDGTKKARGAQHRDGSGTLDLMECLMRNHSPGTERTKCHSDV